MIPRHLRIANRVTPYERDHWPPWLSWQAGCLVLVMIDVTVLVLVLAYALGVFTLGPG